MHRAAGTRDESRARGWQVVGDVIFRVTLIQVDCSIRYCKVIMGEVMVKDV